MKQIEIMNKVLPQAPEGDVKSGKRELLHFEVDGLGDGSNLHPRNLSRFIGTGLGRFVS